MKLIKNMKKTTKNNLITYAGIILVFAVIQILVNAGAVSNLIQGLLVPICVYSIVAVGLNLCVGYLGELSLGHAGFMCVGAFAGAISTKLLADVIPSKILLLIIALIIGTVIAGVFGFLVGIPVLRLKGDYLAIVTLAFGQIIINVINVLYVAKDDSGFHFALTDGSKIAANAENGMWIINGAKGVNKIPSLSTFAIGIIVLLICLIVVNHLVDSRSGRAIMAIRDNRIAAESVGINITKYKMLAFTISAAIAGAGGVLYAHNLSTLTATTNNFGYNMSIMILVYVVLGGMGSFRGSIIATIVLYMLPELLRKLSPGLVEYRMLFYAIILIALMLFNWAPGMITLRQRIVAKLPKFGKNAKKGKVE